MKLNAKTSRTRAKLLEAAERVFIRDGLVDARVSDIAVEAGVAHGTFYTYFDSKPDILREVLAGLMEQAYSTTDGGDASTEPLGPRGRIELANRKYVRMYRDQGAMLTLFEQAIYLDPELQRVRLETRSNIAARVGRSIIRLQKAGVADPDIDVDCTANALVAMVSNFCHFWLGLKQGDFDEETAVQTLTDIWYAALNPKRPDHSFTA